MNSKRKICAIVTGRSNYGRLKPVLKAIKNHPDLELQLIVTASALLYRFGKIIDHIKKDGFEPVKTIYYVVDGENPVTQVKSTGLGMIELSTAFEDLKPDVVLIIGDRFEAIAPAIAGSYMNIPVAHIQGGEVSGNIDDNVRNAITKFSHIHFPSTKKSTERILKMGEEPWRVHFVGCPSVDLINSCDLKINNDEFHDKYGGTGKFIDFLKPYILVIQHPVTTSFGQSLNQINEILEAIKDRPEQKIVLWPNIDAGSDDIAKGLRMFKERNANANFHYYRAFEPIDYLKVLNTAVCAVGNSSSFMREASILGTPVVLVGNRQENRQSGKNVIFVDYERNQIVDMIEKQINHGRYEQTSIYGNGNTGNEIADILANIKLDIIKKMTY